MNVVRLAAVGFVVLGCVVGGSAAAETETVTLKGQFVWERSDKGIPGELAAMFTPSGEGTWDVVFHFEWEGEMREWKGTATGNLGSGRLEGEAVEDRDRKRTFAFRGAFTDGVFAGSHGQLRDGELSSGGTLTLAAP
ncbi:MAG TPA: hypothetical protein VD788_13595 [Candidatus Polarisedimenticolaceae bacterium]|nr:hypothetical protein [Candidatus Polarisedimenticolaceae bacterium]